MWDVLKEYPAARVRLEAIAVKRLEKYKKAPLEKGKERLPKDLSVLLEIFCFSFSIACCTWTASPLVESSCKRTHKTLCFLSEASLETKPNTCAPHWKLNAPQDLNTHEAVSPLWRQLPLNKFIFARNLKQTFLLSLKGFSSSRFCCFPVLQLKLYFLHSPPRKWTNFDIQKHEEKGKRWKIKFRYLLSNARIVLIKLLWDAANQLQVSWNQRIARPSRKCGLVRSRCRRRLRLLLRNKRELSSSILNYSPIDFIRISPLSNLPYSPKSHRRDSNTDRTRITDSPGSMSPSVHSSEERPRSRITSHTSRPQSQPTRNGN